jgi:predicted NBD/HSP70 family sugar kinase
MGPSPIREGASDPSQLSRHFYPSMTEEAISAVASALRAPSRLRAPRPRSTLDVLAVMRERQTVTQPELVALTKLSRGTVEAVVRYLRDRQLVEEVGTTEGHTGDGRPPSAFRVRGEATPALCVDFGRRHVAVGVGGPSGALYQHDLADFEEPLSGTEALEIATSMIVEVLANSGRRILPSDLVGVCVALAEPVDYTRGQVAQGVGDTPWLGIRPAEELRYRLGPGWADVPFIVHNNANLDALAEYARVPSTKRAHTRQDIVLLVRWGNGIGGAVLVNGEILLGARGLATEIGHTILNRSRDDDIPCPRCGHYCLDSFASGDTLVRHYWDSRHKRVTFDELVKTAVAKTGLERELLTTGAEAIGEVVGGFAAFHNANLVIIRGHHFGETPHDVTAYTLIADAIRNGMKKTALPATLEDVEIVLGSEGRLATVHGGISVVLQEEQFAFFERHAVA